MVDAYTVVKFTAYLNLLFFMLILFTCRCVAFWRIARAVLGERLFQSLNRRHCMYWYGFIASVAVHATLALNPQLLY